MPAPLLSICLPNYNTRPYLPARMESILAQTNADWELIVLDSYSDDGSWEYFQQFRGDPRLQLVQRPRRGLYPGWNECLELAKGKYVHIATSDDVESPGFQSALLEVLESQEGANLAYSRFSVIDGSGAPHPGMDAATLEMPYPEMAMPSRRPWQAELAYSLATWPPWFTMNALIFRRTLLEQAGYFPVDLGSMGDLLWSWRAILKGGDVLHVPRVLAHWRCHQSQATPALGSQQIGADRQMISLTSARRFLQDAGSLLPSKWGDESLFRHRLHHIREYGGLERGTARSDPRRFLKALRWSWREDRAYLLRQAASGFGFPSEVFATSLDRREFLESLAAKMNLPGQQELASPSPSN